MNFSSHIKPYPYLAKCGMVPKDLFSEPHFYREENEAYQKLRQFLDEVAPSLPERYKTGFSRQCCVRKEGYIADEIYDNLDNNASRQWEDDNPSQLIVQTSVPKQIIRDYRYIYLSMIDLKFTYDRKVSARDVLQAFGQRFDILTDEQSSPTSTPLIEILKRSKIRRKWQVSIEGRAALEELLN